MEHTSPEVLITEDSEQLALAAARFFTDISQIFVMTDGCFSVALAGGETPGRFYETLASPPFRDQVPWGQVCVFWGDERCVPPEHPDSNFRMAEEALLSRVPIPRMNVHRIPAELPDPQQAADNYEQTLREFFGLQDGIPGFDLAVLGLGTDGHIASLFPGSPVLHETQRLVTAPYVESLGAYRITLTPPVFNASASVLFLVSGHEKAQILHDVLEGHYEPDRLPAQMIQPKDQLVWLVDRDAAARLPQKHRYTGQLH